MSTPKSSKAAPKAAKPSKSIFDPFNSSATGHQRAENRLGGSTSWRDSRSLKLREQFASGSGGGKRVSDTVGAGSLDFGKDGRTENGGWIAGAQGLRTGGQTSLWESMSIQKSADRPAKKLKLKKTDDTTNVVNPYTPFKKSDGSIRETSWTSHESSPSHLLSPWDVDESSTAINATQTQTEEQNTEETTPAHEYPQIFSGLTFYINGSTAPHISDHKLKQLLSLHGGQLSISLARRTVTHVILAKPGSQGESCGGGLAGTKIQREIAQRGGKPIRCVNAEWAVESVKAGKRLAESRFEGMKLAPKGVGGIAGMFAKQVGVKRPG